MSDTLITKKMAAERMGYSIRQIERFIEQGRLTKRKSETNRVRLSSSEVEELKARIFPKAS